MVDGADAKELGAVAREAIERAQEANHAHAASGSDSGPGWTKVAAAVIGPTIALLGIMSGVLLNYSSESAARKSEETARTRDAAIREMEIAVPIYQEVAKAQALVDYAVGECQQAMDDWWATDYGSAEEAAAEQVITTICEEQTDTELTKLNAAINQALIVSNDSLIEPVKKYQAVLVNWTAALKSYRDVRGEGTPEESDCTAMVDEEQLLACLADFYESFDPDTAFKSATAALELSQDELAAAIRAQVLLQDPTTTTPE